MAILLFTYPVSQLEQLLLQIVDWHRSPKFLCFLVQLVDEDHVFLALPWIDGKEAKR